MENIEVLHKYFFEFGLGSLEKYIQSWAEFLNFFKDTKTSDGKLN